MKRTLLPIMVLLASCPAVFAKAPHPLCVNAQGAAYTSGDGQKFNPYLICNHEQFAQLAAESTVTTKYYRLGVDLDFSNETYPAISTFDAPFKGGFDGDGYTLSAIRLNNDDNNINRAPFTRLQNAEIKNLNINGVVWPGISLFITKAVYLGGLAGRAENSKIENVHVRGIKIFAEDHTGGLVGELINSTVHHTSTQGKLIQYYGSHSQGGLVGTAISSDISYSASHMDFVNSNGTVLGNDIRSIGGFIGTAENSRIKDVYADGNIDYFSFIHINIVVGEIAGLVGTMSNSFFSNAYYAGKIAISSNLITPVANLGGAIGISTNSVVENIFWDTEVSGVTVSSGGIGKKTAQMKKKALWNNAGFDPHFWLVRNGSYPKLVGVDDNNA